MNAAPQVLNLLLHGLTGRAVDAAELAFLAIDEQLVDIGDDMFDYEVPRIPLRHCPQPNAVPGIDACNSHL